MPDYAIVILNTLVTLIFSAAVYFSRDYVLNNYKEKNDEKVNHLNNESTQSQITLDRLLEHKNTLKATAFQEAKKSYQDIIIEIDKGIWVIKQAPIYIAGGKDLNDYRDKIESLKNNLQEVVMKHCLYLSLDMYHSCLLVEYLFSDYLFFLDDYIVTSDKGLITDGINATLFLRLTFMQECMGRHFRENAGLSIDNEKNSSTNLSIFGAWFFSQAVIKQNLKTRNPYYHHYWDTHFEEHAKMTSYNIVDVYKTKIDLLLQHLIVSENSIIQSSKMYKFVYDSIPLCQFYIKQLEKLKDEESV